MIKRTLAYNIIKHCAYITLSAALFTRRLLAVISVDVTAGRLYLNRKVATANISICYISGHNGKVLPSKYLPSTSAMVTRAFEPICFFTLTGSHVRNGARI